MNKYEIMNTLVNMIFSKVIAGGLREVPYRNRRFLTVYTSMFGLGVCRGVQKYNYDMRMERNLDRQYLYSSAILHGMGHGLIYLTFPLWLLIIPKEMYRLEVTIRGLNKEKEQQSYYEII